MNNTGPSQREVARFDDVRARDTALTYEPFYRLAQKPFSLAADPQFLFKSDSHSPVFDDLLAGIRRREGLVVLTGDIGMGKTTLCRSAVQQLDRKTFSAFVPDPFMSREDLLKTLLMDFGVVSIDELRGGHLNSASRLELSYVLYEFLDSLVALQAFAVVIIDEAQNLSIPLLEEVRILSDLVGREKLIQVVLVGQLELESKLKLPEMRQVDHRVAVRCSLTSLSAEDTHRYVTHRIAVASTAATTVTFSPDALDAVWQISGGVPRLINLLCDRALHESYRLRADAVDTAAVRKAANRLALAPPNEDRRVYGSPAEPTQTAIAGPPDRLPDFLSESDIAAAQKPSGGRMGAGTALAFLAAVAMISGTLSWYFLNQLLGPAALASPTPPRAPGLSERGPRLLATPAIAPQISLVAAPAEPVPVTYGIQIASFESASRASRLVELLSATGIRARLIEYDGKWHHVRAEGYGSVQLAEADLQRVHNMPGYSDARIVSLPGR